MLSTCKFIFESHLNKITLEPRTYSVHQIDISTNYTYRLQPYQTLQVINDGYNSVNMKI